MSDFLMPALGADMEDGTLVEWLIKPGDRVKRGDVVAVVETQKGAIEVEIFDEGVVSELVVPVGQRVPVGGVLARIDGEAEAAPVTPLPSRATGPAPPPHRSRRLPLQAEDNAGSASPCRRTRRRCATDRHRAGGAVTMADVEAAAAAPAPEVLRRRTGFDPAEMRKAIAAAMSRSKREIPHYYLSHTVDLRRADACGKLNSERPPPAPTARRPVAERRRPGDGEAAAAEWHLGGRRLPPR